MTAKTCMYNRPLFSLSLCCLLIGLLSATPALAEIYTWTDADGNTIYSDQPSEGAKKIELPPPQTYKPDIRPMAAKPAPVNKAEQEFSYRLLDITQPLHDQALWVSDGGIDIVLAIEPALDLSQGHSISISLDGQVVIKNADSTHLNLSAIDRGSHTLTALVQDRDGKTLKSSRPVTFHIHRPSLLN